MLNFILSSKYSLLYPIAVGSLNCTLSARYILLHSQE